MGEALFYLKDELRHELQKDGPTVVLREEFKKRGYPLGEDASLETLGTGYLIIDGSPDHDSYSIKVEGERLAAYTAFVRHGTEEDPRTLTSEELYRGLRGRYKMVHIEHCRIPEAVNIADAGIPQSMEGAFLLDTEFFCRNCVFTELVDFSNTTFQREFNLRVTAFHQGGEFRRTTFQDTSNFDLTTFQKFAHFVRATFKKATHFSDASFQGDAVFFGASFRGSAGFSLADFQGRADFSEAAFLGGAVFSETIFRANADFARGQFVGRIDFTGAACGKPVEFTDIRHWPNTIGHWWRRKLLNEWTKTLMWRTEEEEEQPRWLTRKFINLEKFPSGPPKEATEFFIESGHISEVRNPLFKRYVADMLLIRAFRDENPFLGWLWQWSADYGRSLSVWVFWSALVVLFFAICYTPASDHIPLVGWRLPVWWQEFWLDRGPRFEQTVSTYANEPLDFWSSTYFSVVTFTTLGFGDIATANGIGRVVVTAEVILGYIMLGGLISILAHKLARRS